MSFPFLNMGAISGAKFGLQPPAGGAGGIGGWVEVGRTTLGSNGQTIDITCIPNKRYYMVLFNVHFIGAGTGGGFRLNNDSGTNYSWRYNQNGQYEQTFGTNQSNGIHFLGGHSGRPEFYVSYISNLANREKLCIMHRLYKGDGGATSNPFRHELVGKWTNTSSAINRMTGYQGGSDNFTAGDEIVVLGWDPADTHDPSTNFWEEIGSATGTGIEDITLSSSKKYIWFQAFIKSGGASGNFQLRAGNGSLDTGSNYVERRNTNGGSDATGTSQTSIGTVTALYDSGEIGFLNGFILNNASKEKLFICHITDNTPGSGAGTAPNRREIVGKYVNTSNAIDHLGYVATSGSIHADSVMKVWGAD